MALLASRMNDVQLCDKHGPAPVTGSTPQVTINGLPAVRIGDAFPCGGCANRVQTGASTVTLRGEPAARLTDKTDHGGTLILGSPNVVIGGPSGMGSFGGGKSVCQAMANGRTSGKTKQSYGNCVLESVRQVIHRATGNPVSEDEILRHALTKPDVKNAPGTSGHGGANGEIGRQILEDFGVPAERLPADEAATLDDVRTAVAERRGIVAFVDPHVYAPKLYPDAACHAVHVTGLELDKDGHVVAVILNDTGSGTCGLRVPAQTFANAMRELPTEKHRGGASLLVTKGAVW